MAIQILEASRTEVEALAWTGGICESEFIGEWKESTKGEYTGLRKA